jgi:hypothetical protein
MAIVCMAAAQQHRKQDLSWHQATRALTTVCVPSGRACGLDLITPHISFQWPTPSHEPDPSQAFSVTIAFRGPGTCVKRVPVNTPRHAHKPHAFSPAPYLGPGCSRGAEGDDAGGYMPPPW